MAIDIGEKPGKGTYCCTNCGWSATLDDTSVAPRETTSVDDTGVSIGRNDPMRPEADRILQVFRARGLRAGSRIHPADFGEAIVWDRGFVRDEPVRQALAELFEAGYLIEFMNAFELTESGERHVFGVDSWSYDDLRRELMAFEAALRDAGLRETTVDTYVDRADRFLRWLIGNYQPKGPTR